MVCLDARKDAGVAVAASHRAVIPHFATIAKAADERRQTIPRWRHVAFISLHAFYSEVSATDLFGCSVEHGGHRVSGQRGSNLKGDALHCQGR